MSPMQQMLLGVGKKADPIYVDQVFNNYAYTGSSSAQTFDVGIDLANKGGLIWNKYRTMNSPGIIFDTERGKTKLLKTTSTDGNATSSTAITSFNNNGFSVGGGDGWTNWNANHTFANWIWRKEPGFCDIVEYTGNSTNREIAHSLGTNVGMMIVKGTFTWGASSWFVWHRDFGDTNTDQYNYRVRLSHTNARDSGYSGIWYQNPTSTHFSVGSNGALNTDGASYICYLFAGGESTQNEAVSVDFDGSDDQLNISDNTDFELGNGDFTLETWIKSTQTVSSYKTAIAKWVDSGSNRSWMIRYSSQDIGTGWSFFYSTNGWDYGQSGSSSGGTLMGSDISDGQWHHIAVTRTGGKIRTFTDGILNTTKSETGSFYNGSGAVTIGGQSGNYFDGQLSNVRLVKGTALYTSSFRPPTEPLTNVTNTKLLCCNNSSVTGSTVTPGTITASSSPTASTDSPFDDPAGFKFGDTGDQNVIKCGSYVGSGSAGLAVNVGWEPQFLMVKRIDSGGSWYMYDSIRGVVTGGDDANLRADDAQVEADADHIEFTPTGFNLSSTSSDVNADGGKWLYIAVRRSDGYVGKPPELGTDVFAMATAASAVPRYSSGFPVDFAFKRRPATAESWYTGARLIGKNRGYTDASTAFSDNNGFIWDSNTHWPGGSGDDPNDYQAWMWKRYAGFDCIAFTGSSSDPGPSYAHGLGKIPELKIIKRRNAGSTDWITTGTVVSQAIAGNNNSKDYYLYLNSDSAATTFSNYWSGNDTATHFNVRHGNGVAGGSADPYLCLLFASTDVSKVGYYSGNNSGQTITTGFQPRFIIIRNTAGYEWFVFDTVRGWSQNNQDWFLRLDANYAQSDHVNDRPDDIGHPLSTGFYLKGDTNNDLAATNKTGNSYIYYCHA